MVMVNLPTAEIDYHVPFGGRKDRSRCCSTRTTIFDFEANDNHMLAAIGAYSGWRYFDYRMADEGHDEGYQSMPVNWTIRSARKRGFFKLLAMITGATPPSSQDGIS